jgi:hypothetical protein
LCNALQTTGNNFASPIAQKKAVCDGYRYPLAFSLDFQKRYRQYCFGVIAEFLKTISCKAHVRHNHKIVKPESGINLSVKHPASLLGDISL